MTQKTFEIRIRNKFLCLIGIGHIDFGTFRKACEAKKPKADLVLSHYYCYTNGKRFQVAKNNRKGWVPCTIAELKEDFSKRKRNLSNASL